jgi:hypothetical protein
MVLDKFMATVKEYTFWKKYFASKQLTVVELTAKQHDKMAAESQGVAHFVGRVLEKLDYRPTPIDTLGAAKLHEIKDQTCNDTWELFLNLQNYNPYTKNMRIKFGKVYDKLYNQLLPKRIHADYLIFGIQGGQGSFNQEALISYTRKYGITDFKTKYLYTTENVLKHLHAGDVDYGLFAMHNSVGGIVQESVEAIARHMFRIEEEFAIQISHHLQKLPGVDVKEIDTIMAHPQVFRQCQGTLQKSD